MFGGKKFNLTTTIHLAILVFITLIIFRNLILHGGYLAGMDAFGFYVDASTHLDKFYIWNEASTGQPLVPILNNIFQPLNNFVDVVAFINVLLILVFLLTGVSMYFLSFHLFKNKWISLISAIIYMLNIWILGKWTAGHFRHVFGYSIIPLCYLFFEKYLNSKGDRYLIIMTILFSFLILCGLDSFFIFITSFIIYINLILLSNKNKFSIFQLTTKILIFLIILFILVIYIFIPLYLVGSPRIKTFYPEIVIKNFSHNLFNTLLGNTVELSYLAWVGHTDWNTHPVLPYWLYKLSQIVLPILSISVLLIPTFRRNIRVIALILSTIISIFLAKSLHPPFGEFYKFLLEKISLFHSLSVPNRYVMNVWFAYSLLSPLTLFKIYEKIKSLKVRFVGIIAICILLIFGLSGSYSIFKLGFLIWKPPKNEVQAYLWLSNYSRHTNEEEKYARVVTVPYGQIRMFVTGGWIQHDLSCKSTIFSNKSVFSYLPRSRIPYPFYQYTEYIVKNEITKKLLKILGIYDVRYAVIQGYPWTQPAHEIFGGKYKYNYKQHDYFECLDGLDLIYTGKSENYTIKVYPTWTNVMAKNLEPPKMKTIFANRPPKIYENQYWIPRIFTPSGTILVVGGLDTFQKFAEIDSFNFSDWNLLFADHIVENLGKDELIQQIKKSDYIAFVNSEPLDLAMLLANVTWIKVKTFERDSKGWHEDDWPIIEGYFAYYRDIVSAKEKGAKAIYKIKIDKDSAYEVWIRIFLHNKAGKLKIIINEKPIGEINAYNPQKLGFKWIKAGELKLSKGTHTIEILNVNGENKLNGIVIAEKGEIEHALNYTKQLTQNKSIYLLDIEKIEKIGIDPLKFLRENVIFDDNTYCWNPCQQNVSLSDSIDKVSGSKSLKVNITPRPNPGGVVALNIPPGFYGLEYWGKNKVPTRWMKNNGALYINSSEECNAILSFKAVSFHKPRLLKIYINDKFITKMKIPAKFTEIKIPIPLRKGLNIIRFYTPDKGERPCDVLNNSKDCRILTIAFRDIRIDNKPVESFYFLNWSNIKYISFWFKGTGKGEQFKIWIYFNNSKWPNPDAVRFGPFYDYSEEWREIVIPVNKPAAKYGKIMWDKVSRIVLAIPDKNFNGTIYLDRFSIYSGELGKLELKDIRMKLEKTLNGEVLLFNNSKPLEDYVIKLKRNSNVTQLEFKRISPSKWIVKVNSTGPYTLVFSNTYHRMWKAYVNGKEYNSIPSYYFINSFQINETGEHEVVIEFIGQRIQEISLMISGFAYLGCFMYLFYDWRREKGDK